MNNTTGHSEIMAFTQVSSEHSQPLFLRVNNRNAASRALNAIRAENYAERTQQNQIQTKAQSQLQSQADTKTAELITGSINSRKPEADDFGFEDMLDIINPLHHIPVVSTLYQDLTGDTISAPAKIVGGGLFGGVTGLAGSLVDAVIEEVSGLDIGHHVLAFFTGEADEVMDKDAEPNQVSTQTASLTTNPSLKEESATAQILTPQNTGGIQFASRAPQPTSTQRNSAQPEVPEMPEIQDRIKDPKAAWSNQPNLSPTAFNALLTSFGDSTKTAQAVAQQVAPKDRTDTTGTRTRGAAEIIQASTLSQSKYSGPQSASPINDLLSRMQTGLDKYDQSKNQALRQSPYQSIQ